MRLAQVGLDGVGDVELVAMVLHDGRAPEPPRATAAALLGAWGDLPGLARAGAGGLEDHPGVGPARGARLAAALELGRRAAAASARVAARVASPACVDAWARPRLAGLEHEELWVLALDARAGLRAARRVALGGLSGAALAARDPLRVALREGAAAMVLVHNHPSGDPTPSAEDLAFTRAIARAAALVDVPLLDHVVVARDGYASILDVAASSGPGDAEHECPAFPGRCARHAP